jgi:hypothetical protein
MPSSGVSEESNGVLIKKKKKKKSRTTRPQSDVSQAKLDNTGMSLLFVFFFGGARD